MSTKIIRFLSVSSFLGLAFVSLHGGTVVSSFSALPTADENIAANTTFNTSLVDDQDHFTFDFTFTMPSTLTTGNTVIVDFGGSTVGTALWLENDRLVYRTGGGGGILYLTSTALTASTQYDIAGSIFVDPSGANDEARLYINEADGVDSGFANHQPIDDIAGDWSGGNGSAYGTIGGGDVQNGVTAAGGTGSATGFVAGTDGTLDSTLNLYNNVFLDVVPEPSIFALLAGIFGFTWVMLRRRS